MNGTDERPEGLAEALREIAEQFEPPHHERLHDRARSRVRQIERRRRAAGASLAGLVVAGTIGALAFALPGGAGGRATAAGTAAASTASSAGDVTQAQVLQVLASALPANAVSVPNAQGESRWADGPDVDGNNGDWYVSAGTTLKSSSPTGSTVSIMVMRGEQTTTCAEAEARSNMDTCAVSRFDGGTLILDESRHDPTVPLSEPVWQYYWLSPAGNEIELSITDSSVSDFALAQEAALAVVTDRGWDGLADRLPAAVCRGGRLAEVPSTGAASPGGGVGLECDTDGEIYPVG